MEWGESERLSKRGYNRLMRGMYDRLARAHYDRLSKRFYDRLSRGEYKELGAGSFDSVAIPKYGRLARGEYDRLAREAIDRSVEDSYDRPAYDDNDVATTDPATHLRDEEPGFEQEMNISYDIPTEENLFPHPTFFSIDKNQDNPVTPSLIDENIEEFHFRPLRSHFGRLMKRGAFYRSMKSLMGNRPFHRSMKSLHRSMRSGNLHRMMRSGDLHRLMRSGDLHRMMRSNEFVSGYRLLDLLPDTSDEDGDDTENIFVNESVDHGQNPNILKRARNMAFGDDDNLINSYGIDRSGRSAFDRLMRLHEKKREMNIDIPHEIDPTADTEVDEFGKRATDMIRIMRSNLSKNNLGSRVWHKRNRIWKILNHQNAKRNRVWKMLHQQNRN